MTDQMTVRQYIATQAMAALIAGRNLEPVLEHEEGRTIADVVAELAYAFADAMLRREDTEELKKDEHAPECGCDECCG